MSAPPLPDDAANPSEQTVDYHPGAERPLKALAPGDTAAADAPRPTAVGGATAPGRPAKFAVREFGEYELLEEIARGGMGVVYKARQVKLNRVVAVKTILGGRLANESDVRRFQTEAAAAAGLEHPGIVPVYDVGEYEGQHYFSMGFIDGESLAARIARGPLPAREAAELAAAVADAIQFAHDRGVIHRDLKPANILLSPHESTGLASSSSGGKSRADYGTLKFQPKITDFGLAKRVESDSELTNTGQVLGTPSYMPPEQAAGKAEHVGVRSDVYSLGAMLYTALTGRPPFQAATRLDTLRQVLEQEPVPPRQLDPGVPPDLETILLKCLEKEPSRRYAAAREVADELRRFLAGEPIHARPVGQFERLRRFCRRQPVVASLIAAVAVVLLTGTTVSSYFAFQSRIRAGQLELASQRESEERKKAQDQARLAQIRSDEAERQTRIAHVLRLVAQSRETLKRFPQRGLLLAVEAIEASRRAREPTVPAAEQLLRDALAAAGGRAMRPPEDAVREFALGPDGRKLAIVGSSSDVFVWDLDLDGPASAPVRLADAAGQPYCAAFSPDGNWLATGGDDNRVRLWDLNAGDPGAGPIVLAGHVGTVTSLDFSPDGRRLVTRSLDKTARLWDLHDLSSGGAILRGHAGEISQVAIAPNSELLVTASTDGTARVWDLTAPPAGTAPAVLVGHLREIACIAISPDSRWLATGGGDGTARLWDLATRRSYRPAPVLSHEGNVTRAAFSPDGQWLATTHARGKAVLLWRVDSPQTAPRVLGGYDQPVSAFAFTRDGRWLAAGSQDGALRLWDLAGDAAERAFGNGASHELRGHEAEIASLAISADGRWLASGSADNSARLWDLTNGAPSAPRGVLLGHEAAVESAAFSGDGRWLITATRRGPEGPMGEAPRLWDLSSNNPAAAPLPVGAAPTGILVQRGPGAYSLASLNADGSVHTADLLALSPDRRFAVATDGRIGELTSQGRERAFAVLVAEPNVRAAAFSPDGVWLATAGDENIRLWSLWPLSVSLGIGAPAHVLTGHAHDVASLAFDAGGRWLASGSLDGTARLWPLQEDDPAAGAIVLAGHDYVVSQVEFSPDENRLATASLDKTIRLWPLAGLQPGRSSAEPTVLRGSEGLVDWLAYGIDGQWLLSQDGRLGATGAGPALRVWRATASGEAAPMLTLSGDAGRVLSLSADRRWLVTPGASLGVRLWDLKAAEFSETIARQIEIGATVELARQSPDRRWLAMAGADGSIWLADLQAAEAPPRLLSLGSPDARAESLTFQPDSSRLAATSRAGLVRVWDLTGADPGAAPLSLAGVANATAAFSLDGAWLTVQDASGAGLAWPLALDATLDLARRTAGRSLTPQERQQFMVLDPADSDAK